MYTLDEINTILSDLDACGHGSCLNCSRSMYGRITSTASCFKPNSEAASVIRCLLSEFHRYSGEQMEVDANA